MVQFLQKQTNPAFKGLYQANGFDLMLLIPYFIVLIILAAYGFHRYQLVWMYYRTARTSDDAEISFPGTAAR